MKSIVKEIKKRITPLKFYVGWENASREVKFTAERLPAEAAAQILRLPQASWSTATVSAALGENDAAEALGLEEGELKGSVWQKGGAIPGRPFGACKARRLGAAALTVESLKLSYTVKSQRLSGSLVCVNGGSMAGLKRSHRAAFESSEDGSDFSGSECGDLEALCKVMRREALMHVRL